MPCRMLSAPAGDHGCGETEPGIARGQRRAEAGHRAQQHHTFYTQIQHPGALGKDFTDAGKQQNRP